MRRKLSLLMVYVFLGVFLAAALPLPGAAHASQADPPPLLELLGAVTVASQPNSMLVRCEGHQCSRYHELVYWGFDNRIYFHDARTLAPNAQPLITSLDIASISDERYLFYDRFFQQIYALDKYSEGDYPNTWDRLKVHVIRGYAFADYAPVNASFNTGTPVDRYYPIDGAALQQPTLQGASVARIFIDNTVNGNVDIVAFHGHNPQAALVGRFAYRAPLACAVSPTYCSWHENPGSSLAVDASNRVYIADNNDFIDRIVVRNPDGSARPNINNLGSLFDCFVEEAGLGMAPAQGILYLPAGCQSLANGAVAGLDITAAADHQVTGLPYYDQGLLVDWSDSKRVFAATTDHDGVYDPQRRLWLHLLYDGQLLGSLPVMPDYVRGSLKAMTFDPFTRILYLAVNTSIYRVKVNYGGVSDYPPLPTGEAELAPGAAQNLRSSDSSAVFEFGAGSVAENSRASYAELPPASQPGGTAGPAAGMHILRQFELHAVKTANGTPIDSFNMNYRLNLAYSPREMAPVIGGAGAARLYRWDGSAWQPTGDTYASSTGNLLYIYTNRTGRFAVMGPTRQVFLPAISR